MQRPILDPDEPPRAVAHNIAEVVRLEREAAARRSLGDRVADLIAGFAGTVGFVLLHLLWFGAWAAVNTGLLPILPAWDPYPFQLLCMVVSMEGVLLSAFVLIKQNRMGALSEERSHLDLQVGLLAEQEVTKVLQMLERIGDRLGIAEAADQEAREMGRTTAVGGLARRLRDEMRDRPE